jgi:hypothetical protein
MNNIDPVVKAGIIDRRYKERLMKALKVRYPAYFSESGRQTIKAVAEIQSIFKNNPELKKEGMDALKYLTWHGIKLAPCIKKTTGGICF